MNIEEIYDKAQKLGQTEKRNYIKNLKPEEQEAYKKYSKKMTNKKYFKDPQINAHYNMEKRDRIKQRRAEEPEKFKEINRVHNEVYRAKKTEAKTVVKGILDDIINNVEVKTKKKEDAKELAKSIINEIIDEVPVEVKKKQIRTNVAICRERKKKGLEAVPYKKRGRPKKAQ